jgi:hypothetical protein
MFFSPPKDISVFHTFGEEERREGGLAFAKYYLQTILTGYATDNNHNEDLYTSYL